LPHDYIPGGQLRLEAYRNPAQAADAEAVAAGVEDLQDRYGHPPEPAENHGAAANGRHRAPEEGVYGGTRRGKDIKFGAIESLPDSRAMRLKRMYPGATHRAPMKALMVPRPKTKSVTGKDLVDADLLQWAGDFIAHVFGEN